MTYPHGQQPPTGMPPGQQPYQPPSGAMMAAPGQLPTGPQSGGIVAPGVQQPYGQQPYGQQPYGHPPYGQQMGYGPGMPGQYPGGDIPDYKGWVIGSFFLCWIIAIFAIMKSNEVNTYKMQGNLTAAHQASQQTKNLCLTATIVGACLWALSLIIFIIALSSPARYYY